MAPMSRRTRPTTGLVAVAAGLAALTATPCRAAAGARPVVSTAASTANAAPAPAAPASVPAAPEAGALSEAQPAPIPLHAVPRASESVMASLEAIQSEFPAGLADEVRRDLSPLVESLALLERGRTDRPPEVTPGGELADRHQEYLRLDDRLAALESRLEKQSGAIQDRLQEVGGLVDLWDRTREAAIAASAPPGVLARIEEVRAALAGAGDLLRARRDDLLDRLVEISAARMQAAAAVRAIVAVFQGYQDQLFRVESVPLWSALRHPPNRFGLTGEILAAARENARAFQRFLNEAGGRLAFHAAVFVGLIVLFAALGPGVRRRAAEDESLAIAARILSRPAAAALLIALVLTLWIQPLAPRAVYRFVMLIMVVPLARLLPGFLEPRLIPGLRWMAVLYVLDRIVSFASPHSLLLRILLLLVIVAAAAVLGWELRPAGGLGPGPGRWRRTGRLVAFASLGLLLVSIVANIAGNVSLAELLSRGVLVGAYVGLALYASARTLESLWRALLATRFARRFAMVARHGELLRAHGIRIIVAAAALTWIWLVLRLFGLYGPLRSWLSELLGERWVLGGATLSLGDGLLFAVTLLVSILLARFLRFVLDEGVLPPVQLPRGVPTAISATAQYIVLGAGLLLATLATGMDMTRFTFLAGALGVGVGFGLQNVVNNFVSGLILLYERPVQMGDVVEVGALLGEVRRIGIRSSTVRTYDGAEVIVPNASLISQEVVNWTLSDRTRRVEIKIGVAYGSDPARVLDLLVGAARGRPGVLDTPSPVALLETFGDSALEVLLRFWTAEIDRWTAVRSEVATQIYAALQAAGIEIPFPQRDLHLQVSEAGEAALSAGAARLAGTATADQEARVAGPAGAPAGTARSEGEDDVRRPV